MTALAPGHPGSPAATVRPGDPAGPALRRKRSRRRALTVLAFMAPWIVGFTLFLVYPLVSTVYFSFTNYDLISAPAFVGLRNYTHMFTADPIMWIAIRNTAWLTVAITVGRVLFALVTAVTLTKVKRATGIFRTLYYLPALVPPVAGTLAFVFLFNPGSGPVNKVLGWFGIEGPLWFQDPALAKPALTMLVLWGVGELMIIVLASLLDVPTELYEAAGLDGAGAWRKFWHVTLPSIVPVLLFSVVTSVIAGLQFFTQAMVAGSVASGSSQVAGSSQLAGYPENSTMTFPMWLYQQGFQYYNMGYASAMAVVLFLVSGAFTLLVLRRMTRGSDEAGA
ncbi:carbohydrate ABC transporter permease [Oerskovia enterophila]|uniref:carbohydrate ABC transporter permease n=1 Tax=Oerskovia enterophila TaxID=43678 RepID=UPI00339931FE